MMSPDDLSSPSGVRMDAYLYVERLRERIKKESSEPTVLAHTDPNGESLSPSPAMSAANEDEGQRYLEDLSASEMSDKYPAGLHPLSLPRKHSRASSETTRERRRVSLDVRLTEAEREAIRLRARVLGVKPSTWARGVLLDSLDARRDQISRMHLAAPAAPSPELATAVDQLRKVGQNLNQALRAVHSGEVSALDDGLLRQVQGAVDNVRESLGDRTTS
ncbi:plasmid mobilization protein [Arthrobacter sp. zg-Y916]|uniref:plasmid mobilization protein n=1 Tax=Arthrobacter sp. zg-Y916 TaxID=2894190 RepID=UPI003FA4B541